MPVYVGFTNVFADKDGHRYPSGTIHPTAAAAVAAQSTFATVGEIVGVAQVIWDEPDNAPWRPWSAKS